MTLSFTAWQQVIQKLTQEEKDILLGLINERLTEIAQQREEHAREKKEFEHTKQQQLEEDHQKLQALYNKLKTL